MSNEQDLTDEIHDAALAPKTSDHDGVVTTERSIDELIKADEYLAAKRAAANQRSGLRFFRLSPPGTT